METKKTILKKTNDKTFGGGIIYSMNLDEDVFVHFTLFSRAIEIAKSRKLLMNPPYKKFGIDAVHAISLIYGKYVPGVQKSHIEKESDEEIVAILFTTNTVPDYGYAEEVIWHDDVAMFDAQIISFSEAVNKLKRTPEKIGGDDMVRYI